ncbi:hypothetical protein JTE90_003015 [Oedothorax gibbosus]|uniref:Protein unc-79 homolog n=1 Tax=Oedothorax gibbosus TaxID=931172 RepID=A0AAV6VBM5_9ARAC|nr:hypothetical protein JTE90_003015 [Oedothorax gibbosus]
MGTRAAAFTAKIHNLQHYSGRIKHNLLPLPSGDDVANTLKYFSQTLLSVLRDVPSIPLSMLRSPEQDSVRTALFPSLDYRSLLAALVGLVDAVPLVQHGSHALGSTILHVLSCLVPFLEHDLMDTLPTLVSATLTSFPASLHRDVVDLLCNRLLPFTFRPDPKNNDEGYASMSTVAVLMTVFQYTDCTAFHCQVLECLMGLKKDIVKDVLCVIAHGTAKARCHAVELLFQYLPTLHPALLDRKGIGWLLDSLCTLTCLVLFPTFSPSSVSPSSLVQQGGHTGWKPRCCQREECPCAPNNEAVKMCFDHSVALGDHPPPLYLCEGCAEEVGGEGEHLVDVVLPMEKVAPNCEHPDCKAADKAAVATCFSAVCARLNGHRPIRLCTDCMQLLHDDEKREEHMLHATIPSPWNMDPETQSYMVEAVVSLLREAEPVSPGAQEGEGGGDGEETSAVEERQLLSKYGVWLMVGLCTPDEHTPHESLGRLLSMLFQWFHYTACLPDVHELSALERLKKEYIHGWLMEVVKTHFEVFVSCLLPHPVDYAKVGGHWESWPCYPVQIKEGFKRLICLAPYDILTVEVWEYIMPYWMDALRHKAVESEFNDLKILLSKVLDPDLSPLAFTAEQMYLFLIKRFKSPSSQVQEQALYWMQILSLLEVPIPLELLYSMFNEGIRSIASRDENPEDEGACTLIPPPPMGDPRGKRHFLGNVREEDGEGEGDEGEPGEDEVDLHCYILMLDVLIKQLELHDISMHKGLDQGDAQAVLKLIRSVLEAPWEGTHTCSHDEAQKCEFCEVCALFFQLALQLVEYFSPVMEVSMADVPSEISLRNETRLDTQPPEPQPHTEASSSRHGGDAMVHTATVVECEEEAAALICSEVCVEEAFAIQGTITEDEVAGAKCTVASAILVDENNELGQAQSSTDDANFWKTSQGKFKFTIEELPPQLQLFYALMKDLPVFEDADVLYHILACLKVLCLHSEVLNKAAHTHRGFLIWCQENCLVINLWKLLQMEFSHIAQLATSLLLHSITLLSGFETFWKILEEEFHNKEWRARFAAVEKASALGHFADSLSVKSSPLMQGALAGAFCYLVSALGDEQPSVSQRALLNLDTIKTPALKLFVWCLEVQFDSQLADRPVILQTILQLHNRLQGRRFLTWEFFLNRFDTLFLEDQIALERNGDASVPYVRDLKNSNVNSEMFQKKLKRAQEALAQTANTKSLTFSFGPKMPYKRAMSAPTPLMARQDKIEKDKYYERQSSAPVLKRKSSRLVGSTIGALGPLQHFPNSFFTNGAHLKDSMQEESHFLSVLHRAMDVEDHDKETLPLLVFLLMQFLSRPDPIHRSDDKITRSQHIVLRHLNILLGYSHNNQGEARFLLLPHKVRSSAIFSTFLMCMPKVLDYNFAMGSFLLPSFLCVLVGCPSPLRYPDHPPLYSLWSLDPFSRHSWLQAVLVIVYKYHYDNNQHTRHVHWLILIVLNTLKTCQHRCKHEPLLSPLPNRSRDFSTPSAADMAESLLHDKDQDSAEQQGSSGTNKRWVGGSGARSGSERSCSSEGEEPELEAIPESPKSEGFSEGFPEVAKVELEPLGAEAAWTDAVVVQDDKVVEPGPSSEPESVVEKSSFEVMEKNIEKPLELIGTPPKGLFKFSAEAVDSQSGDSSPTIAQRRDKGRYLKKKNSEESSSRYQQSSKAEACRMQSLPFESNQHQSVCRSKTDGNILDLPREQPATHSRYPRSKLFQGKRGAQSKAARKIEMLSSDNLTVPIFRPPLERLLPIGTSLPRSRSEDAPRDLCEDKGVQTGDLFIDIPAQERLLPVGPPLRPIARKDSYPPPRDTIIDIEGREESKNTQETVGATASEKTTDVMPETGSVATIDKSISKISQDEPSTSGIVFRNYSVEKSLEKVSRKESVIAEKTVDKVSRKDSVKAEKPTEKISRKESIAAEKPTEKISRKESIAAEKPTEKNSRKESIAAEKPAEKISRKELIVAEKPVEKIGQKDSVQSEKPLDKTRRKDSVSRTEKLDKTHRRDSSAAEKLADKIFRKDSVVVSITEKQASRKDSVTTEKSIDGMSRKDSSAITKELPILELSQSEVTEPKLLPKNEAKKWIEEGVGSALGGDFINRIFDLSPCSPAFGVFDVCKNAMDMRNSEDNSGKDDYGEKNEAGLFHDGTTHKSMEKSFDEEVKARLPYRQRKQRKSGVNSLEAQRSFDYQNAGQRRLRKGDGSLSKKSISSQGGRSVRGGADDEVSERCTECCALLEEYSDEEVGLCVVVLATFVRREPAMAAPLLPTVLKVVSRIASSPNYPWQNECNIHLPGGSVTVARQFIRCTLNQLAPNGIFLQIFQSHVIDAEFYKTMSIALADFNEVNQVTPLILLFESLNESKQPLDNLFRILENVSVYLDCLSLDSGSGGPWCTFLPLLDAFLRKLHESLQQPGGSTVPMDGVLRIILCALRLPVIRDAKNILDPFSKILSHAIQHSSVDYNLLSELCTVCNKNARERDKMVLTRTAVFELVQALKFKTSVPDANLLTLVQFILTDCGGRLAPNVILENTPVLPENQSLYKTWAGECMQQYVNDALEFVADVHTLSKVKNMAYGGGTHLNEETLGGHLKAGLSQFLAVEFAKNNGRDNRVINRHIPWLFHPPTTLQQGPRDFAECVSHIRLLSWLLLGALLHSSLLHSPSPCTPIPLEESAHIAHHVQNILSGFTEQSKTSVLHMSSLFHAFILCQLWTMYCEHMVALNPPGSEQNQVCGLTLTDFWAKLTPSILQLVCHSKEEYRQLAEMVSLHFLSLMEALQECNSTILARLLPMWTPVLFSFQGHVTGSVQVRLQGCVGCRPPVKTREDAFLRWLQRLQFKMGQIEMQSSAATHFYTL